MTKRPCPLALGAILAGLTAAPIAAQRIDPLGIAVAQGATVRLTGTMIPGGSVTGWLIRSSADSVAVATKTGPREFSLSGVTTLEVARGRDRLLWGVLGSLAGFAAAGIKVSIAPTNDWDDLALATFLPVVGGIVGAVAAPQRWRRLTIRGIGRGVGVGIRVRF